MTHAAKVVPVQMQCQSFLSSTRDAGEWPATRPSLLPAGKSLPIPTEKGAQWAHSQLGRLRILKNPWPLSEIEPRFLGRTFLRLVNIPTNKPKMDSCYGY
jgi:hypothetical protein